MHRGRRTPMTKPTVYLETTLIGHLVGRLHPNTVIAARQIVTRDWWHRSASGFQLFVSQLVAEECAAGDPDAADERSAVLQGIDFLNVTEASRRLARRLTQAGAIPATEPRDALHVAIAAANGIQYLLTWNFKHLANAVMREEIERVCLELGFEPPIICTPDELLGDDDGP